MGLQTENLVLANRSDILGAIGIHPQDVVNDDPFIQKPTKTQSGVQVDYLIQTVTKTLYLCEIKFSRHEIKSDVIQEVQRKMKNLALPKGFAICPVLLHFGEVADAVLDARYFYRIIDIGRLCE